jgi:transglutaminase-like putative cysteine protease
MRQLRRLLAAGLLLSSALCYGQTQDWLPVTPQDLQVKEVPGQPGAAAIQLYYSDQIDDPRHTEFLYSRIKILTEKGLHPRPEGYADVELEVRPGFSVHDIKARTIHPDGQIVEFTGKPFDKTIVKGKGFKYTAKTFTMPDVTVGSIIEYRYRISSPDEYLFDNAWVVQHGLYTLKEHFTYRGQETPQYQVAYVVDHLDKKPEKKRDTLELDMENVPAFESEPNMPPEDNYKPRVDFYYVSGNVTTLGKFWDDVGKALAEAVEHYIGNHKEARDAAAEAIGSETDSEKKLRKLYARAQQIRNLSYERERTATEQKKENLKDNGSVADVLKRGFGDSQDINRAFVAMARAAGFDASVIFVSSRHNKFFQKNLLSVRQLDSEIADVVVNGKDVYLDPGTKYCPYGLVRWMRTAAAAMKVDRKSGTFLTTPAATYKDALTYRTALLSLSPDGTATGTIDVRFAGSEALEHRLDALETDEAGRTKSLEDELKTWLPLGANVKVASATGWDKTDDPLDVSFKIEIPGYASAAGKRVMIPVYLFQVRQKNAFQHNERKYPVYFPYAFAEADKIIVGIPAGFTLEGTAPDQNTKLPYAVYVMKSQLTGSQLVTERQLALNGIFFDTDHYGQMKDFFGKVQAGDEQQAVLGTRGAVNAKTNQ